MVLVKETSTMWKSTYVVDDRRSSGRRGEKGGRIPMTGCRQVEHSGIDVGVGYDWGHAYVN